MSQASTPRSTGSASSPGERLARLRRLGGLDGHPDVGITGIEANSGSLGMGISKGRGIAWGKRLAGRDGVVVVHDGRRRAPGGAELGGAPGCGARQARSPVDRRRPERAPVRPDDGGDPGARRPRGQAPRVRLGRRDAATATTTRRCATSSDGSATEATRRRRSSADTIKGKGVSFMEHPTALVEGGGLYRWHAGAPADDPFERARAELGQRIADGFAELGLAPPTYEPARTARGRASARGRA